MSDLTQDQARQASEGSDEAFARLFERLHPVLAAWATLRLRGPVARTLDPDDLVQEVWWRALERFDTYDPDKGLFRSWLFGIAGNVLREQMRRHMGRPGSTGARRVIELDDLGPVLEASWTSITKGARRSENAERLVAFVQALDADDRTLFIHRGLEGLALADAGKILGITENACNKRWLKIRAQLERSPLWSDFEADIAQ